MHIKKALARFRSQKNNAKRRGIEFKLTFKEWCDFWGDDISLRGKGVGRVVMMRIGDSGAYEVGNIEKGTWEQNLNDATSRKSTEAGARIRQRKLIREIKIDHPFDMPIPSFAYSATSTESI